MTDLCRDLTLSIVKEDDPDEKDRERVRVTIANPMEMQEITVCEQINQTTHQSRRYHVIEATVIVLRKAVSEAFREGLITDSLGEWKIARPKGTQAVQGSVEVDLNDSLL